MKVLKHPGFDTTTTNALTGADRQLTVDIETRELRLHDGLTPGGARILNKGQIDALILAGSAGISFAPDTVGLLTRVDNTTYTLRALAVSAGITITNANGVAGNPTLAIDEHALLMKRFQKYGPTTAFPSGTFDPSTYLTVNGKSMLFFNQYTDTDPFTDIFYVVRIDGVYYAGKIATFDGHALAGYNVNWLFGPPAQLELASTVFAGSVVGDFSEVRPV